MARVRFAVFECNELRGLVLLMRSGQVSSLPAQTVEDSSDVSKMLQNGLLKVGIEEKVCDILMRHSKLLDIHPEVPNGQKIVTFAIFARDEQTKTIIEKIMGRCIKIHADVIADVFPGNETEILMRAYDHCWRYHGKTKRNPAYKDLTHQ